MSATHAADRNSPSAIPSVDRVLREAAVDTLVATHGRHAVLAAVREVLEGLRDALRRDASEPSPEQAQEEMPDLAPGAVAAAAAARLAAQAQPGLRRVFNLTGTVLHTNLGRAPLPAEALAAIAEAAGPSALEFDLASGGRGDRDDIVEDRLCRLTGAEAATVVNNNAAAVLLVLNSIAAGGEVVVSRGELVEIGGAFRIPEIMSRAGCRLHEVGTTNRTHPRDYETAVNDATAALMKVHTSNYSIEGFTASVDEGRLVAIAHAKGLPLIADLGSGTLVDLEAYGLPHERTAAEAIADGVDLVTFSGDKLLGGPQCGLIVGRRDLVAQVKRNPMKRALRVGKITLAALDAVLRLYADPDRLVERLPTLRLMTRGQADIAAAADRLRPSVAARLGSGYAVSVVAMKSQIGSGALPVGRLESAGLSIASTGAKRGRGAALNALAAALRAVPVPVIGRVGGDALLLDLRCLDPEDEMAFVEQFRMLSLP